ncbi:MAG TPA: glycosyltransferase family 2 protein [Paludibacteraceae bacterium]|nr:glycosyltransferase family 2 protein [Paludibacteraceae bacterium]
MLASIIIPTYNHASVILSSLETWTHQTMDSSDFEVIIVDNNSIDETATLVQTFIKPFPNFHYVLETKTGATCARHRGAAIAKADILMFCDDDGLFNPSCIEEILKVYYLYPQVSAVAGKINILWDEVPPEWIAPYEFMLGKLDYGDQIVTGKDLYLNGGLFSIRKQIFEQLGGFNPDLIGSYQIGDGDTGLVNKLHEADMLIGWTPFAIMEHLQFVKRHGTVKDIGRRCYNAGIATAYAVFRKNDFHWNRTMTSYFIQTCLLFCKKFMEYGLHFSEKEAYFKYMKRKGELTFFGNLRKKEIRKELLLEQRKRKGK